MKKIGKARFQHASTAIATLLIIHMQPEQFIILKVVIWYQLRLKVNKVIKDDFKIDDRVVNVIDDNKNPNKASCNEIEEQIPRINTLGCQAHNLHLLAKDLCKLNDRACPA